MRKGENGSIIEWEMRIPFSIVAMRKRCSFLFASNEICVDDDDVLMIFQSCSANPSFSIPTYYLDYLRWLAGIRRAHQKHLSE